MSTDREYMRVYMRARYHRRKREAQDKLGGRCVDCGAVDGLEFHHRDPSQKSMTIGKHLAGASERRVVEELGKCDLLCDECHKKKHAPVCGTVGGYKVCRCVACRAAQRDYMREYRSKRRAALVEKTHTPLLTDEKLERYQ